MKSKKILQKVSKKYFKVKKGYDIIVEVRSIIMKKVYILLMHTNTMPSKIIKFFTRYQYTHVGIALEKNCENIYSFGRKKLHSFWTGGFTIEKKHGSFFKYFHKTMCQIYEIDVTKFQFMRLQKILKQMTVQKMRYKYDYFGLILRYFKIPFYRKDRYVCSYFVADVLKQAKIISIQKPSYFIVPKDFTEFPNLNKIYEGQFLKYE